MKIQLEDFRMMTESFGMQLDDDSLLALFSIYDTEGSGYMKYEELMMQLLDPDYYSLYIGNVDNTKEHVDAVTTSKMVRLMRGKFKHDAQEMRSAFLSVDEDESGNLGLRDFCTACAVLGVVLTERELDYVCRTWSTPSGIDYSQFLEMCQEA